jgi:ABC-2 type transport system permease protein
MTAAQPAATTPASGTLGVPGSRARPLRTPRQHLRDGWRAFATAARIGWQTESNWADPLLFVIYSMAKPIASVLILVFMLQVISGGNARPEFRAFVVVGSALWSFVVGGTAGLAWSLLDDRERYRMLKYLYISPNSLLVILLGRGAARLAIAAMGALITLAVGIAFLGVDFDLSRVDWLVLVPAVGLGFISIVSLGIILAAVCLQTRQESWSYPEAVAGALFLLVGAVFPLSVLPVPVQALGFVVPLTWWLEGVRQALVPGSLSAIGGAGSLWSQVTGTPAPSSGVVLAGLLVTTAVSTLGALAAYRWSERRAKERGLLDQTTGS